MIDNLNHRRMKALELYNHLSAPIIKRIGLLRALYTTPGGADGLETVWTDPAAKRLNDIYLESLGLLLIACARGGQEKESP